MIYDIISIVFLGLLALACLILFLVYMFKADFNDLKKERDKLKKDLQNYRVLTEKLTAENYELFYENKILSEELKELCDSSKN